MLKEKFPIYIPPTHILLSTYYIIIKIKDSIQFHHKPWDKPVHILAANIITVGEKKSIGDTVIKGTANVNKDQKIAAIPNITSPPYLSLKYPPMICAGMYPQKKADITAPWKRNKITECFRHKEKDWLHRKLKFLSKPSCIHSSSFLHDISTELRAYTH